MKMNQINEGKSRPEDIAELWMYLEKFKQPWEPHENPGDLGHGEPCPICKAQVVNKRRGLGAPKFLGCQNNHAFLIKGDAKVAGRSGGEELDELLGQVSDAPELQHTCRFPPSGMEDDGRIRAGRKQNCDACNTMYDLTLDYGFDQSLTADDKPDDKPEPPEELSGQDRAKRILDLIKFDPRREHEGGKFGTGRPASIKPGDSPIVAGLKAYRDRETLKDPVTGAGKRQRKRDLCGFGHTCGYYPNGRPAWNYPLPDPMSTINTGEGRFNKFFRESPRSTKVWPVSGLMGFAPKAEYESFVEAKMACELCQSREKGEEQGCTRPVSQEYGAYKPFCKEHVENSPYPQQLLRQHGGPGLPDQPDPAMDSKRSIKSFEEFQAKTVGIGDRVRAKRGRYKKYGVGTVSEIDRDLEDRTHYVEFESEATPMRVWLDPALLDIVE